MINPDAEYRAFLGHPSNPRCPDYSAHLENAADRLKWNWRTEAPTYQEQAAILDQALAEYLACDGHDE